MQTKFKSMRIVLKLALSLYPRILRTGLGLGESLGYKVLGQEDRSSNGRRKMKYSEEDNIYLNSVVKLN